jgi:biopolymer transport protein TolR
MGMSGPSGGDSGLMAEINVTPFVDVMLVLLIIFMVTAPLMTTGVDIDLPRAEAPAMEATPDQLVIAIDAAGTYQLGRGSEMATVTLEQLQANLVNEAKLHPEDPVFVSADGKLQYEQVLQILALAKDAGVPKVGLMTQPMDAKSAGKK